MGQCTWSDDEGHGRESQALEAIAAIFPASVHIGWSKSCQPVGKFSLKPACQRDPSTDSPRLSGWGFLKREKATSSPPIIDLNGRGRQQLQHGQQVTGLLRAWVALPPREGVAMASRRILTFVPSCGLPANRQMVQPAHSQGCCKPHCKRHVWKKTQKMSSSGS